MARRVVILGAAGRDFHNFNVVYREAPEVEVVAFTATQIPGIAARRYPAELAGPRYPDGIAIEDEQNLEALVRDRAVDEVVFGYSDVSHEHVMHLASRAMAAGADFSLLGPRRTMLASRRPVVAVGAVRTGCGKSAVSRAVVAALVAQGRKVVAVRHPMPYGDLRAQRVQRFGSLADLDAAQVTIEEREEYEPHIDAGSVVYAGVDYGQILAQAEQEADVIVWDGGNNDLPFFKPNKHICLVDPHRLGHESRYHPGETNVRMADLVIVSKVDSAPKGAVEKLHQAISVLNPRAQVLDASLPVAVDDGQALRGRKVLAVEDGPTLTHGGMTMGAGTLAVTTFGGTLVDPRPYAQGSIRDVFAAYPEIGTLLPATGYGPEQIRDLGATINAVPCDVVVVGTPIDLRRVLTINKPAQRVRYELDGAAAERLKAWLADL